MSPSNVGIQLIKKKEQVLQKINKNVFSFGIRVYLYSPSDQNPWKFQRYSVFIYTIVHTKSFVLLNEYNRLPAVSRSNLGYPISHLLFHRYTHSYGMFRGREDPITMRHVRFFLVIKNGLSRIFYQLIFNQKKYICEVSMKF